MEKRLSILSGLNVIMCVKVFCKLLNVIKMWGGIIVIKICYGLCIMVRIFRNWILKIILLELIVKVCGN